MTLDVVGCLKIVRRGDRDREGEREGEQKNTNRHCDRFISHFEAGGR